MASTQITSRLKFLLTCLVVSLGQSAFSQSMPSLGPVSENYKYLKEKSSGPNKERQALDSVHYPWAEYSKAALGNALWRTNYLLPEDEAKLPELVKAPANSSDQTRADLDYLLKLQNERTKEQVKRAEFIANIGSWPNILNPTDSDYIENRQQLYYIINTALGKQYNFKNYPATTALLMNCIQDIRVTEFRLKYFFKRPRPYHLASALHPLTRINSPSFPSGHSLWSYTEAYIFGELLPTQRTNFIHVAEEVQSSREILGIHYPSDNEASRILGWYLVKFWYNNPKFRADLAKAKKEWGGK
ncbi:MAG: phosphatase PAP2 family protein [Sphingobacteriales bacterium]|nr:MAG: phosphatase PAP2 family protein [Sphingobacteriales bacterium]